MRTREALAVACSGRCVIYVANDKHKADHRFSDILKFLEGLDVRYEARKADIAFYDELEAADGF